MCRGTPHSPGTGCIADGVGDAAPVALGADPSRSRAAPGTVEVDETFIGGEEPGLRGGRAKGKKSLVGVAVELTEPEGYGRCRMALLADASAGSLQAFLRDHVEPGAVVITDGWMGYHGIGELGCVHDRRSQRAARARGDDPGELLPGVHRVASLAKRWLLGTHQGAVDDAHLWSYLDEFVFRFNRSPLTQPRARLLPRPRTRGRARARALPGPHHRAQGRECFAAPLPSHFATSLTSYPPILRRSLSCLAQQLPSGFRPTSVCGHSHPMPLRPV
ncbi:MAG: IS1595 family transposase [Acidimicrobiales bacterium]